MAKTLGPRHVLEWRLVGNTDEHVLEKAVTAPEAHGYEYKEKSMRGSPATSFFLTISFAILAVSSVSAQVLVGPPRDRVIWVHPTFKALSPGTFDPTDIPHEQCKAGDCPLKVIVTVDPNGNDPSGRTCAFEGPKFVVVTKNKNTKITWTLTEKSSSHNAKFADDAGGRDGIRIYLGGTTTGHFKNRDRKDKTFSWERDHDPKDEAKVYFYDININHDYGGGKCDTPDPIIVNRD